MNPAWSAFPTSSTPEWLQQWQGYDIPNDVGTAINHSGVGPAFEGMYENGHMPLPPDYIRPMELMEAHEDRKRPAMNDPGVGMMEIRSQPYYWPNQAADDASPRNVGADDDNNQSVTAPRRISGGVEDEDWTYSVDVFPALDLEGEHHVDKHTTALFRELTKSKVQCSVWPAYPGCEEDPSGLCRRYTLPKALRDNNDARCRFLKVFTHSRRHNRDLQGYRFKMTVVYEHRGYMPTDSYPSGIGIGISDLTDHDEHGESSRARYSPTPVPELLGYPTDEPEPMLMPPSPASARLSIPPTPPESTTNRRGKGDSEPQTSPRQKPIPKPKRRAEKNANGRYACEFPNCTEPVKEFSRKCEWSKHMDKHDRPYKCPSDGCEKLPGFTYSGGLLRHEREVHGKHGGPKNPLYCPHKNCKRHTTNSFTRLENLNEHLRRVHTTGGGGGAPLPGEFPAEDSEEVIMTTLLASPKLGDKRKADDDLRDEVKRLQGENQDLHNEILAQRHTQIAMMQQIEELRETIRAFAHPETLTGRLHSPAVVDPLLESSNGLSSPY